MVMLSKFSNFPDELSENDELREYELSGSDSRQGNKIVIILLFDVFSVLDFAFDFVLDLVSEGDCLGNIQMSRTNSIALSQR